MMNLTKTMTMTSLALIVSVLAGLWLASTTPANSLSENAAPSMSVESRLGAAELALCDGQAWPHFSQGCTAWIAATSDQLGIDRSVSTAVHDYDHGFTIISKAAPVELAAR